MSTTTQTTSATYSFITPGNPRVLGRMGERRQAATGRGRQLLEEGSRSAQPTIGFMSQCKPASNMPSYPGLERWRLVEKLGDGAFSSVYRASDTKSEHKDVAIKVMMKYKMNDRQVCTIVSTDQRLGRRRMCQGVPCLTFLQLRKYRRRIYVKRSISHES